MAGFNISSLFGSSASGFGAFNFGDYAAIRNGSYKRLMRSYYGQSNSVSSTKTNTTTTKKSNMTNTWDSSLSAVKTKSDGLKKAAEDVSSKDLWKKNNGTYKTDKITDAVKTFIGEYNKVIDETAGTGNSDVSRQVGYTKSMTNTMASALSKVGITVETNGKLTMDEVAFKNADMKDVESVFSGSYSYASQIGNHASAISSAAVRNSSLYGSSGTLTNSFSSVFNKWT